jgi:MFS family permease
MGQTAYNETDPDSCCSRSHISSPESVGKGKGAEMAGKTLGWRLRDYIDLTVIATTHGLSDGFSSLLVPVLALIVADLGLSTFEAGLLLSVRSIATFLFLYPLSMLADSTDRKKEMLIVGLSLAAGAYLAMGAARSLPPLAVLAFLAGAGNATYHPCGTALTAKRFKSQKAVAISFHGTGGNIGTSLMPLLQSAVVTGAGWRTAVGACALPAAVLLPLIGVRFSGKTDAESERLRGNPRTSGGIDRAVQSACCPNSLAGCPIGAERLDG